MSTDIATTAGPSLPADPRTMPPPGIGVLRDRPAGVPRATGTIRFGLAALGAFVAAFALWGLLAPLSSAAVAHGSIKVEGNRKTIQHLEGGIISEILVKEGDTVKAGDVLVRLDLTQSDASAESVRTQRDALLAAQARLTALRNGAETVTFPDELTARAAEPRVAELMASESALFRQRRAELEGQTDILSQQIEQSRSEIGSYKAQIASQDQQMALIQEEIAGVRELVDKGLERRPRLLALERNASAIEGARGNLRALISRAEQRIGELQLQTTQVKATADREVAANLTDVETKLATANQQLRAATDVLDRREIVAPTDGKVINLRFVTPGGVVRAGEPIMDLVPTRDRLVVEAQVQPTDIDVVHAGLSAEVRLTAFKQRVVPVLYGTVTTVSADAVVNDRTGLTFYKAEVEIDSDELAHLEGVKLVPGMPADVMIETGRRTLFDYFMQPISDSFHRAFRED